MKEKISNKKFQELIDETIIKYAEKQTPKILHQMAMEWNETSAFLNWLIDNPKTEKATALMIYWMSGPRFFKQFRDRETAKEVIGSTTGFDFTENLENKYLSGFYKNNKFSFDPNTADYSGVIWAEQYLDKNIVSAIPAAMFEKMQGEAVEEPQGFIEGMPPELNDIQDELYEKYDIE